MKIACLGCGSREFDVGPADVETAHTITFICPDCGTYTAVSERIGGGMLIGIDKHASGNAKEE